MKRAPQFLFLFALVLSLVFPSVAQAPAVALKINVRTPFKFVAYGDIRFLNPADKRTSDPVRRKLLVDKIASEKPAFLLISGDLVANGSDDREWGVFDQETAPLRNAGVPIYPALGNHDLRGDLPVALKNYFQRFPDLQNSRYYSLRADNLLIITLDSSLDRPGGEEMQWFDHQIETLPGDIQFVVVQLHHPPLTRSHDMPFGGGHSPRRPEQEMASFIESRAAQSKAKFVVVAGHVHNYERYERNGVMYVVTGGGGATPYMINREPNDFYKDPGPTYHYCRFEVTRGKLAMHMIKLIDDGKNANWQERDSFEISAK
ncbi:MAG TPA: metallophosphoesterase [Terriglobales bacterium]|nr:metallophosphoesterase [Terriglobales bacterium]